MEKQNTIRLGICMAGAVSAGAYTAGVIDYLIEALENWQKAKDLNLPSIPKHNVIIEIISGASAGGMTAAITAASLQKEFPHVNQDNYHDENITKANPLFDSWVNLTEEANNDMMSQMLNTDDIINEPKINSQKEVVSGFNSSFIDTVAKRTINGIVKDFNLNRPYIAKDLEIITTLTNLRGFNYKINFISDQGESEHRMTMHRDFAHFQLNETEDYKNDGKIPLHFNDSNGLNKDMLIDAAMATGAFPLGLKPRIFTRDPKYINQNILLTNVAASDEIVPNTNDYENVCVDGGVLNNEPFELTQKVLVNRRKAENEDLTDAQDYFQEVDPFKMDTTLVMIDPFPNYNEKPNSNYYPLLAMRYAAGQTLWSMREELIMKQGELKKVYDENDYSRFMIAPRRTKDGVKQTYSIACGSFGGFGGFLSKEFRVHDYMLGRRNCQSFLKTYFSIPLSDAKNNQIIKFGYEGIEGEYLITGKNGKEFLPIIPDIRIKKDHITNNVIIEKPTEEKEFTYPQIKLTYILNLKANLKSRLSVIFSNIANGKNPLKENQVSLTLQKIRKKTFLGKIISNILIKPSTNFYLFIGKTFGKGEIADFFLDSIISDVEERELLIDDVNDK